MPLSYINRLYTHFIYCKTTYNCEFYSIIGNHDISNELERTVNNTSLGNMFTTGAIHPILVEKPLIIDNYRFNTTYVRFTKARKHIKAMQGQYGNDKYTDVLCVHHFYEDTSDCFTYDDYKGLGCKYIFMGHEHCPLPQGKIEYPEFTIFRSGSMTRGIAAEYNFDRTLYYIVIDTETDNIYCEVIDAKPAKDVFTQESFTRENYQRTKFVESIDNIIDKYANNTSVQDKFSIYNILLEINAGSNHIEYIRSKYQKIGERFD